MGSLFDYVCDSLDFYKQFGATYIANEILLLGCRIVLLHVLLDGGNIFMAFDIDAQQVVFCICTFGHDILWRYKEVHNLHGCDGLR